MKLSNVILILAIVGFASWLPVATWGLHQHSIGAIETAPGLESVWPVSAFITALCFFGLFLFKILEWPGIDRRGGGR